MKIYLDIAIVDMYGRVDPILDLITPCVTLLINGKPLQTDLAQLSTQEYGRLFNDFKAGDVNIVSSRALY